jgi:stage V sporulation protein G
LLSAFHWRRYWEGLMVCMPSRKKNDGTFKDIAHPITNEFRHELEQVVLQAFDAKLKEIQVAGSDGTSAAMTDSL